MRRTGIRDAPLADGRRAAGRRWPPTACATALADAGRDADRGRPDHRLDDHARPAHAGPGPRGRAADRRPRRRARSTSTPRAPASSTRLDQAAALVETGRAGVVLVVRRRGAQPHRPTRGPRHRRALRRRRGRGRRRRRRARPRRARASCCGCDPEQGDLLYADRDERKLRMEGREVYRHAVARMVEATREALRRAPG